jgi:hypothetical protein
MQRKTLTSALLGVLLAALLPAAAAQAQATRTWVSGVGDDANPCSRTAPCKTFAGAISKTAGGGSINVLDPGGFGGVTIQKSITISADHVEGGVLVSGTNGITVSASVADTVVLEGLDIEGLKTGLHGVNFVSGALLVIERCKIHQFATDGVNAASSTPGATTIINKSFILSNGTQGQANKGGVTVAAGNTVNVIDTQIQANLNYGLQVSGSGIAAFIRSVVAPTGIVSLSGGQLLSVGPSNAFASGAPTSPFTPFQ